MRKIVLAVVAAVAFATAAPASAEDCDIDLGSTEQCNLSELIATLVANAGCTGAVNVCGTSGSCSGAVNVCGNAGSCSGAGVSVCASATSCTSKVFNWC